MKIGVLTFHDGINYGAYLQVYALHKKLEKLGFKNTIINYKTKHHHKAELLSALYAKRPLRIIKNFIKYYRFVGQHKKMKFSLRYENSNELINENYDTVIVGSDEVWNYTNKMVGYDLTYFGKPKFYKKIISYAASFGKVDKNDNIDIEIVKALNTFNAISVRDENSYEIIEKNTLIKPNLVLDPTFLYDYKNEIILPNDREYLLVYTIGLSASEANEVKRIAKKYNLKIIGLGYFLPWTDNNIMTANPFEFLGYIYNAKYIFTTMFHGTIFAIKYQKQFCTLATDYRKRKLDSVLGTLGIANRMVNNIDQVETILQKEIDYHNVNKLIDKSVKASIDFLNTALSPNS